MPNFAQRCVTNAKPYWRHCAWDEVRRRDLALVIRGACNVAPADRRGRFFALVPAAPAPRVAKRELSPEQKPDGSWRKVLEHHHLDIPTDG
ncbi:hypothetical protein [Amycolatopsis sp. cg9]|uniref:hypothetical protein n=1 Tax=Amycolatopsis sp. cg9 TaxID=3238801 RepID=UPI0035232B98